jgi:hypothetical protein
MSIGFNIEGFFSEAIRHSRNRNLLREKLTQNINIDDYANKTFEQIISEISISLYVYKKIGPLAFYDITSAICRYHNINIEKVYIIGGGPVRAVKLLNIEKKKHIINNEIELKYVDINDVINAFDNNGYDFDESIRTNTSGDILESYLCIWQKTIK